MTAIPVHPVGALIALAILTIVATTIVWMVNPPRAPADIEAQRAERAIDEMSGSIIVVFSEEIHSEPMMVLAARLARRERAELLAVYVVEVPLILPQSAAMPDEDRRGYDALATAEAIAQHSGVTIRAELLHTRQAGPAVVDLAVREGANLIVLGSYREGKYTGAPLGRAIEAIASGASCDVLIGVPGTHGRMLGLERPTTSGRA